MKFNPTAPRLRVALISALLFVCATAPAFGQATTTTTSETIPFNSTLFNPCNADTVTFQGNIHITNHLTNDASGGYHLKSHANYQGVTGTGFPSGLNYRVSTTNNETVNDSDTAQFETTVIQTIKLVAQGMTPNYFLQIVFHVTVNANGQTTSTVNEVRTECRGRF